VRKRWIDLHRSDRKPDGERAFAAATFLSGQYDAVHAALPFASNQTSKKGLATLIA
jgi:hypothetical protein